MSGKPLTAAQRLLSIREQRDKSSAKIGAAPDSTAGFGSRYSPGIPAPDMQPAAPARGVFGRLYNSVGRTVSAPFRAAGRFGSAVAKPFVNVAGGPDTNKMAAPEWAREPMPQFESEENSRYIYDSSKITDLTDLSEEDHIRLSEPNEFAKLLKVAGGLADLNDTSTLIIEDQPGFTACDVNNMFSFMRAFNSPAIRNRVGNAVAKTIAYRLDKNLFDNFIEDEQNVDLLSHIVNARKQGMTSLSNASPQNKGTSILLSSIYAYLAYFKPYRVDAGKVDKSLRGSYLRLARSLYEFYPKFLEVIMAGIAFVEIEMTTKNGKGWRKRLELIDKERQSITNISDFLAHIVYMYIKIKLHQNGRQNWDKHDPKDNTYALNNTRKGVRAVLNRTFTGKMPSFGRANILTRGIEKKFKGVFEIPTEEEVQSYLTEKEVYHRVDHSHRVYYRNIFELIYSTIAYSTGFYLREMMLDAEVADADVKEARNVLQEAQRRAVDAQADGDAEALAEAAGSLRAAQADLEAKVDILKKATDKLEVPAAAPAAALAPNPVFAQPPTGVASRAPINIWSDYMKEELKGGRHTRSKRHTKRRKSHHRRH